MKTRQKFFRLIPILMAVAALSLSGCRQEKPTDSRTGFERNLTAKDTADVENLVNVFFEHLEKGEAAEAAYMLCQFSDSAVHSEPLPLPDSLARRTERMLRSFPIVAHRIDYMKFSQTYANEVKVTAIIAYADGDMPEVSTALYFRPYDYLGNWRLCLVDTNTGGRPMLSGAEKDSLMRKSLREDTLRRR